MTGIKEKHRMEALRTGRIVRWFSYGKDLPLAEMTARELALRLEYAKHKRAEETQLWDAAIAGFAQ